MSMGVVIGNWVEREARVETRCPGYYAADYETHRTKPGKYSLTLTFEGGYLYPMPKWLTCGVDSDIIDGKTYSGFGGVNYAARDIEKGPSTYSIQAYSFMLPEMIKEGQVELLPGMEWVMDREVLKTMTWDKIRAIASTVEGPTGQQVPNKEKMS